MPINYDVEYPKLRMKYGKALQKIEELEAPTLPDDVAKMVHALQGKARELRAADIHYNLPAQDYLPHKAADLLERQQRDLAILNAEWERSTGVWQEEVAIKQQRIEELEADLTLEKSWQQVAYATRTNLEQRIEALKAALNEICRLTAPGGFPSYKHLHTITLKAKDDITRIKAMEVSDE